MNVILDQICTQEVFIQTSGDVVNGDSLKVEGRRRASSDKYGIFIYLDLSRSTFQQSWTLYLEATANATSSSKGDCANVTGA